MSTSGFIACIAAVFTVLTFLKDIKKRKDGDHEKNSLILIVVRIILIIFIVVPGIMWYYKYPDDFDGAKQAIWLIYDTIVGGGTEKTGGGEDSEATETLEEDSKTTKTLEPEPSESEKIIVDPNQVEDFSKNLDPKYFYRYTSGIDDFYFRYPNALYNQVESNTESVTTSIGENIETHKFTGNRGSSLTFSLYKRTNKNSLEMELETVEEYEAKDIADSYKKLLPNQIENGEIRTVFTGRNKVGKIIYVFIMIDDMYVMDMRIECPDYKDNTDEMRKRYVQECIYRYCGFKSDSVEEPRSYDEFLKSDKK